MPLTATGPSTTIAWRLWHLINCYGADRNATWLDVRVAKGDGGYADSDRAGFVFHMLDEFIHHGAEVALLRDLFGAEHGAHERDPLVRALLAGDDATVTALRAADRSALDRVRTSHPDLVLEAASAGRWHAIALLLDSGFAADVEDGAGPLHHAAGAGRLDVVKLLVDHGADTQRVDPSWRASAQGWAEYFRHRDVADYLASCHGPDE